ncbi:proteinase T-like [Patiria miniata]|uniref:Peptidase S8/S53 domain-containing protein n=1 Tax=Patiria miniata TaxID=46514 RepID=A0A914ASS4_PATMI|nr:proteinase T-like [Patiria miniata]
MRFLIICLCVALANAGLAPLLTSNDRSVPNSWIIKIKDFDEVDHVADEIASRFKRMLLPPPRATKIRYVLPALTLQIPARLIDDIRSIEGIEYIEQDSFGTLYGTQVNPIWNLDRIDSRTGTDGYYNYNDNVQGKGVNVYIMDTGIQTRHKVFTSRASVLYGDEDSIGHGTHVAGTAAGATYGIAREANVYSLNVCNMFSYCPKSTVVEGLQAVREHGGTSGGVVSISLGWSQSETINTAVKEMVTAGYVVSVAAGNSNIDACSVSPASVNEVITVGAVDDSDTRAGFSNHGACLDIFAPGVDIVSSTNSDYSFSATKIMSGTSMACPHVTGAVELFLGQNPGATPAEVKTALLNDATSDVIPDTKGSPNKLLYISVILGPIIGGVVWDHRRMTRV